jgi:hypothetical protein
MSFARLLSYKLRIFLANFSRGESRKRYLRIASLAVILAVFVAFSFGAVVIFGSLRAFGDDGFLVASFIVTVAFHALLLIAFVFDVATTTNIFFLSSDLGLLMAAPLSTMKIFALKFIEALGSGSTIPLLVGVPVLVGYGAAFGAPPLYYIAMFAVLGVFLMIPVAVGTLFGLLISRFVPAARVKELLGVVGGALALGVWITTQLVRPKLADSGQFSDLSTTVKILSSYAENPILKVLPSHLAARSITAMVSGTLDSAPTPLITLTAMAGTLLVTSLVLAQRMYLTGWTRIVPARAKVGHKRVGLKIRSLFGWLPSVERSIVTATMFLFVRDAQQIMPVATITIMMALFPFVLGRSRPGPLLNPILLVQSFAALSFVGSMNLATNATVIDGRSFWMIMTAPCSAIRKLLSKLLVSVFFFTALTSAIALGLRITGLIGWPYWFKLTWFAGCVTCVGSAIGIFMGITYADWEWEMPKRMLRTSGRLLMLGIMAAFFVVIAILVSASSAAQSRSLPVPAPWLIFGAGGLLAALITYGLLRAAAAKLDRMEWKI